MTIDIEELADEFIFSDTGRELNAFINDNQGQMSANKLLREVFKAGYKAKKVNMNNTPIDIEKLAEEHLTPFARTGWTAYGEQLKQFAEALLEDKEREIAELKAKLKHETSRKHITELQAHINDLREALEEIANTDPDEGTQWFHSKAEQALLKTPAQSLQSVINETIEMCAEEVEERGSRFEAEIIRALKDNYDR